MLFMYDKELIIEILKNITWSLEQIIKRFQIIKSSDDFLKDDITHHYFDIDADTVHVVCSEHIPDMKKVIKKILDDLENEEKVD